MRDQFTARFQSFQRTFGSFTAGQKTIAVIGGLALVLGAVMVFRMVSTPAYAPLFTSLSSADASAVVDKLNAAGTPYKLADGGNTVLVPEGSVYDSRIALSGEGLPSQGSEGYGLLDKQSLSTSDFQEQTTYKRAIEGELQKTIEALDSVDTAVVHVAMPQEELFATEKKPTTASVLVATHPGSTVGTQQVQAIVHLVASSVEGLDPTEVTVSDSAGNVLSTAGQDLDSAGGTRAQAVESFEGDMSDSVDKLLTPILGPGKSVTEVTADLDFDKTLTNTTRYFKDPKVGALSSTTESEKYGGTGTGTGTGGIVGPDGQQDANAATNGGTTTTGGATAGPGYESKKKTADNAVNKTVEQREAAPGSVKSIHVAVAIDTQALGASTPQQVQALVASALGINTKRGDTLVVNPMPFSTTAATAAAAELAAAQKADAKAAMTGYIKTGGIALVLLAAGLVAWLKGRKRRKMRDQATSYVVEQLRRSSEPAPALPAAPAPIELAAPNQSALLRGAARDEIAAMVEKQPEEVANLLRGWLVEADR
jgi:flagellar M-ring protein FliF